MRTLIAPGNNAIEVARRKNGGLQITQGKSYIMLSRAESVQLVAELERLTTQDSPARAEKATQIGNT